MSPQVEAAWIAGASGFLGVVVGVTGTVIVGVAGFRNTRKATTVTNAAARDAVDAQLQAVRDNRMYDKRAETYVDLLATMGRLGTALEAAKDIVRGGNREALSNLEPASRLESVSKLEATIKRIGSVFESMQQQDHHILEARLQAFGTPEVYGAYIAAGQALVSASGKFSSWARAEDQAAAAEAICQVEKADQANDELVMQVRRELVGEGPQLPKYRRPDDLNDLKENQAQD